MKKLATSSLAALMAVSAAIPMTTTGAEARHRGARVAAGVVLGAAALAVIANSNRAHAHGYSERRSGFWYTCRKWYRQCQDGNDWACEKYETRGCTE